MSCHQFLLFLQYCAFGSAWQQWRYASTSHTTDDWRDIWGFAEGPRGRQGHTLVVYEGSKLILFGGRDDDMQRPHVPRTFDLEDNNGTLDMITYEDKPVSSIYDPSSCEPTKTCVQLNNATSGNSEACTYSWNNTQREDSELHEEECGYTEVALFYNDVWIYDLNCTRYGDTECVDDGWTVLHPGATYGGCRIESNENRICDAPGERWRHGAAILNDHIMIIYGGFSQECEDYCDDLWAFDLKTRQWEEISAVGNSLDNGESTPGKRWHFSLVSGRTSSALNKSFAILFGGHRLWEGISDVNSKGGGYLNDLWIYISNSMAENETNVINGVWLKQEPKERCAKSPGLTWETRNKTQCDISWPQPRAGHATVYDEIRHGIWLYGGYTTYYPHLSNRESGRNFVPFPSYPFFLDDLWFYDMSSGFWEEKSPASIKPKKRTEHTMGLSENLLIVFGGYADNHYYNDTWYYYIDENRWLEKKDFVHADFPDDCIDDLESIKLDDTCIELQYPKELLRANMSDEVLGIEEDEILPFKSQPGYHPDGSLYFGIVDDAHYFVESLRSKYLRNDVFDSQGNKIWIESTVPDGTPIAPHAATGPRQFARIVSVEYNTSTIVQIWEWCVKGKSQPSRGRKDEILVDITIAQPKRQSVGWDGCRNLKWKYPTPRSGLRGAFVKIFNTFFLYGGVGPKWGQTNTDEQLYVTPELKSKSDMWAYNMNMCMNNCSEHGQCKNGFCECDTGYYGADCSNLTCAGTVCSYDRNHEQHCKHCCHDGYEHNLHVEEDYVHGVVKRSCSISVLDDALIFSGQSNGVCDGFGSCHCSPPFIGDDCSVRDCTPSNCSDHGYCIAEYPVARCNCHPEYFGKGCEFKKCPNNCTSERNGVCDYNSGLCDCKDYYDPDFPDISWGKWKDDDCSAVPVWSAGWFGKGLQWKITVQVILTTFTFVT